MAMVTLYNQEILLPPSGHPVVHNRVKVLKGVEGFGVTLIDEATEVWETNGANTTDNCTGVDVILEQESRL